MTRNKWLLVTARRGPFSQVMEREGEKQVDAVSKVMRGTIESEATLLFVHRKIIPQMYVCVFKRSRFEGQSILP